MRSDWMYKLEQERGAIRIESRPVRSSATSNWLVLFVVSLFGTGFLLTSQNLQENAIKFAQNAMTASAYAYNQAQGFMQKNINTSENGTSVNNDEPLWQCDGNIFTNSPKAIHSNCTKADVALTRTGERGKFFSPAEMP